VSNFKLGLGSKVRIEVSGEEGTVEGRAEYRSIENQYYVRYKAGDGRAVEAWWSESAIEATG
jgi:hypothetical protein